MLLHFDIATVPLVCEAILSWVLTKLPVKVWMVVCIHTALKNLSILGYVKKPSCNPHRAYAITVCPSFTYVTAL